MKQHAVLVALGLAFALESAVFVSSGFLWGRGTGHDVMPHLLHIPACFAIVFITSAVGINSDLVYCIGLFSGQTVFFFLLLWICHRTHLRNKRLRKAAEEAGSGEGHGGKSVAILVEAALMGLAIALETVLFLVSQPWRNGHGALPMALHFPMSLIAMQMAPFTFEFCSVLFAGQTALYFLATRFLLRLEVIAFLR